MPEGGGILATHPPTALAPSPPSPPPLAAVASAAREASEAPRDLPLRIEGSAIYLQLAAFTALDNAENFLSLIEFQLSGNSNSETGISYAPRVRSRDNLFRVELGPYASRDDAQRAAHNLESRFGVIPSALSK